MQPNASIEGKTLTACNIMIAVMLLTALQYFPLTNLLLQIMTDTVGFIAANPESCPAIWN